MKSNYKQLGQFIRQVDVRNTDGREDNLLGVSVQKKFIPSIANTVGTDFRKYKIVKRGQFTYIPDTSRRGDKIAIALLLDYEEGIVSNVYTVFEVIDENQLLSEYLMLWFMRPEFDRYARFKSHGSVREVMDWDEMCKVELPVPEIEKQRQIVKAYNTINDRIALKRKINDNLSEQTATLFQNLFSIHKNDPYKMEKLGSYVSFSQGTQVPVEDQYMLDEIGDTERFVRFIRIVDYTTNQQETPRYIKEKSNQCSCSPDEVTMVRYGNVGLVGRRIEGVIANNIFKIIPKAPLTNNFLYYFLSQKSIYDFIVSSCGGSAMPSIKHRTIGDLEFVLPTLTLLSQFEEFANKTEKAIRTNNAEIILLRDQLSVIIAKLLTC